MIRITDVRSLYVCLSQRLVTVRDRAPLGDAGERLKAYAAVCQSRLCEVAVRIATHPSVVGHVGGVPFGIYTDLDVVHVAELQRFPVVLPGVAAVGPMDGPAVGVVGVGASSSRPPRGDADRRETSVEYL